MGSLARSHVLGGVPRAAPEPRRKPPRYLGWQDSLALLAKLVEAEIKDSPARRGPRDDGASHPGSRRRGWRRRPSPGPVPGRRAGKEWVMDEVQHIGVYIARPPAEVYEFASDPRNLPRWAAGLARSEVRPAGDAWVAEAPFGTVRVRFAEPNALGVMDHEVTLESGVTVHNPMRVVPHGNGSEVVFTLMRQSGMSDERFALDRAAVQRDLHALKTLLEQEPGAGRPGPLESGHAPVNGIRMYYEVHGRRDGVPLVLLHGGGSTLEVTFGRVLSALARRRRVIAVEEQGHGRTSDRDAPVAFETSADDVAALLRHLNVEQADLFGFSNGASVALHVALRHPALVRKLVFASSMTRRGGARPEFWDFMARADFANMPQALKDAFLRVNPDERALRRMHDKDAARMRSFRDVPDDAVRSVRAPTLILAGDRDIVRPEHAVELAGLIPGARLLILPGGHGDCLGEAVAAPTDTRQPELTVLLVEQFLDEPGR
jgi:pimeloyl-ACP methyl ester carboxylesterase